MQKSRDQNSFHRLFLHRIRAIDHREKCEKASLDDCQDHGGVKSRTLARSRSMRTSHKNEDKSRYNIRLFVFDGQESAKIEFLHEFLHHKKEKSSHHLFS
eukprot:scaffold2720_cov173-Amphora_coffeaeformis.AAC.9